MLKNRNEKIKRMGTSSKFVALDNKLLEYLFSLEDLNSKHISIIVYLKDMATSEEGGIKYIKSMSVKELNSFLKSDTKYRTARKLLETLLSHSELFIVDKAIYNSKLLVKNTQSFSITLEDIFKSNSDSFTKVPETLLHKYPEGISTYLAIRYTHSERACIDIPRIQKMSKVKRRNTQLEILDTLEEFGFIRIIKDRTVMRNKPNKYECLLTDEIEFERRYNKYNTKKATDSIKEPKTHPRAKKSYKKEFITDTTNEVKIGEWDLD